MSDDIPFRRERARELVRGAVDYHIHVAPDFVDRRITDVSLARRCLETGQAGFGLKSHYNPTAERASVVAEAVEGVTVLGSITLNRSVGGLNPLAVEIAAREGARIVWFPTVSSVNEQDEVLQGRPRGQGPGVGASSSSRCARRGSSASPVPVVDERRRAAARGARGARGDRAPRAWCCAPGTSRATRSSRSSTPRSRSGIEQIVVTHPEFPSQNISADDQVALADKGAVMERCFTTTFTGKAPWERSFEATRAVGAERTVWSTDLGQKFNPPVEDGMALMADRFLEAGFGEDEVRTMAVDQHEADRVWLNDDCR